jgi:hypothetical protein
LELNRKYFNNMDMTATNIAMVEEAMRYQQMLDDAVAQRQNRDDYLVILGVNGGEMYPPSELSRFGL